jgi:hypothetical protein
MAGGSAPASTFLDARPAAPRAAWASPRIGSTVVITVLFGIFGVIPAGLNTARERQAGRPTSRYWKAFWWSIVGSAALYLVFVGVLVAGLAASTSHREAVGSTTGGGAAGSASAVEPASPSSSLTSQQRLAQAIAAGQDPSLSASENAIVKAVAADPTIVPKVQALATRYQSQLATAAKIDTTTQQALSANPNDVAAQANAVSDISGVPVSAVAVIVQVNEAHDTGLQAVSRVDHSTLIALLANPDDQAAAAKAAAQIVARVPGTTHTRAARYVAELKTIPIQQLLLFQQSGQKVITASDQLRALAAVPPDDLALLTAYGRGLQDPKVQAALKYLQDSGH